jgi:hypothetical protein
MHVYNALLKSFGFRISLITGKKADVPAEETKMVAEATIPATNVGSPMTS